MILSKYHLAVRAVILSALFFSAGAQAQSEPVLVKRPAQLRDAPGESSRTLAQLPLQTPVTRLGERQGPWIKVRMADGASGWLHIFDITAAAPATAGGNVQNAGANALRGLASFFNKGSAQAPAGPVATSTVGIRGLGAEDLAASQPNILAVVQAETSRMNALQARQFAQAASLASRPVEPLPVPAVAAPSATPGFSGPDMHSR